jgi:Na+-transporting NADH:ubiquinone oxidoreductase subunit D
MARWTHHLTTPLVKENPVTLQILGICSALAVTTSLTTAAMMSVALTAVLCMSAAIISLIRHHIPTSIRLIIQITIIASLVIVIDELMQAFAFEISQQLSVFVGLIVTNCLVLGRAEAFAMRNPVGPSILDGLGNGLRLQPDPDARRRRARAAGRGHALWPDRLCTVADGGWFEPLGLMQLAPAAFFIIGLLIWVIRTRWTAQIEAPKFKLHPSLKSAGGRS